MTQVVKRVALLAAAVAVIHAGCATRIVEPEVGQPGRDAVWVPTTDAMVEKMLDVAKVTPADLVVDLGSGDGRMIIAAARRGARGRGVEFNEDLVNLSRQRAREAGVPGRATFVQGDMYEARLSDATVLALFLLPANLEKLADGFMTLAPGSRIVLNTYGIPGWEPDLQETLDGDCITWCTVLLHYVPARVGGTWQLDTGELVLAQRFQKVTGALAAGGTSTPVIGRLRGSEISMEIGSTTYTGSVAGDRIQASGGAAGSWTARRVRR